MATNRNCRWRLTLPLGPLLPYNIGDWMTCANGHPLRIFVSLSASGQSRLRISTDLIPGLTHDQIPCPDHHELLISSCLVCVTLTVLFHVSQTLLKLIITIFLWFERWLSNFSQSLKRSLFLLIISRWLSEIARILFAYQYLIVSWISFFSICRFWYTSMCFCKREERTLPLPLYWLLLHLPLLTSYKNLFLAFGSYICKYRTVVINFRTAV